MGNDYDKIFKENITAILLPLAEKILGINIKNSRPIKDKLQDTVEREADYLSIVEQNDGKKFILHLEFQTTNETNMVERMQLYFSLLRRKYSLPVVQKVLYFGNRPAKMRTELKPEEIFIGFELISLNQQSYKNFIDSSIPEELILTILTNFEGKDEAAIIIDVIKKLRETNLSEIAFKKYVRQLIVLSRLRGLNEYIKTALQKMPITYNIEEDAFYKEGLKRGLEKVKKEKELRQREKELRQREKELRQREKEQAIIQMLKDGLPVDKIATYLNMPLSLVRNIAERHDG
ncbi:MAG: hypothetical protein ACOCXH_07495 [Cyclobacteriaceae bacterium]